jgi:hypothetical protein
MLEDKSVRTISQDLQFGARSLLRRRGVTIVALSTLALGIGTNTAVFSVVDTVLLQPLAYKDPGRIVFFLETSKTRGEMSISMPNFDDWRAMNNVFEGEMDELRPHARECFGRGIVR